MTQGQIAQAVDANDHHAESLERYTAYLGERGVDLDNTPWACGPVLSFDSEAMRFTGEGSDAANALVRREYRGGFVVPEEV